MTQNFLRYLIQDLLIDSRYKSDRERARALARCSGLTEATVQTRISRARRSSLSPPRQKTELLTRRLHLLAPTQDCFYVYCIECITPNHFYVGQSKNIVERLRSHERGATIFTQQHGISRYYLIAQCDDLKIALRIEYLLYKVLQSKNVIVGGMSYKEDYNLMQLYANKLGY